MAPRSVVSDLGATKPEATGLVEFLAGPPVSFVAGLVHGCQRYCPIHSHPAIEIVYHVSGRGTTTVHDVAIPFTAGSVVLYPPYVEHDQRMAGDGIDACILVGVEHRLPHELESCIALPPLEEDSLRAEVMELAHARSDPSPLVRAALAHRATAVLARLLALAPPSKRRVTKSRQDRYFERAQRFIGENYHRLQSVEEVAKSVGISPDHLRHLFKRHSGTTVIGYLTSVRLARAKALLGYSDLPIKTIAGHCGFKNERYFSEVFRKLEGLSPGEFRRG